jgi:uncharacterized protein (DUF983 family)
MMKLSGESDDALPSQSALAGIARRQCPRCRRGSIFASLWVMHDDCPECRLDFDRGDPGHFTGAMYVSYALAIPLIALLTLIEYLILPRWSLFRLVVLASLICVPLIPWLWQYSRVIWIYFDRYFDPEDDPLAGPSPSHPSIPSGPAEGVEPDPGAEQPPESRP